MNFVQFPFTYKIVNSKLTKLPDNVIPRIFPTHSCNPKGPNFALYFKYRLLRYKPWILTQDNAWENHEASPDVFITFWHDFLQTPNAHENVPDWFDKLQDVVQNQEQSQEPIESDNSTREEWMILSDLDTPFESADSNETSSYDWHQDRTGYTEQQIGEISSWIKTKNEQCSGCLHSYYEVVDINTFSQMQELAYNII